MQCIAKRRQGHSPDSQLQLHPLDPGIFLDFPLDIFHHFQRRFTIQGVLQQLHLRSGLFQDGTDNGYGSRGKPPFYDVSIGGATHADGVGDGPCDDIADQFHLPPVQGIGIYLENNIRTAL